MEHIRSDHPNYIDDIKNAQIRSIFLTNYRKSLSPVNLEAQLCLHANKKFWTVFTIKAILNSHPDDKQ